MTLTNNLLMPASMADGTLARWLKRIGERVEVGDAIAEVETDKALMQIESPYAGVLVKIQVPEGSASVPVDTMLALIEE